MTEYKITVHKFSINPLAAHTRLNVNAFIIPGLHYTISIILTNCLVNLCDITVQTSIPFLKNKSKG